jgi:hypothetical protein
MGTADNHSPVFDAPVEVFLLGTLTCLPGNLTHCVRVYFLICHLCEYLDCNLDQESALYFTLAYSKVIKMNHTTESVLS